jgi:hypothetical protein
MKMNITKEETIDVSVVGGDAGELTVVVTGKDDEYGVMTFYGDGSAFLDMKELVLAGFAVSYKFLKIAISIATPELTSAKKLRTEKS